MDLLTKHEEILLISIYRLKAEAYGASLKRFILDMTGKDWNYGNLYCTLDQLVKKGYISKSEGDPTPSRGGRRKNFYAMTSLGTRVLRETLEMNHTLTHGLQELMPTTGEHHE